MAGCEGEPMPVEMTTPRQGTDMLAGVQGTGYFEPGDGQTLGAFAGCPNLLEVDTQNASMD